jgi:hypothetical protein
MEAMRRFISIVAADLRERVRSLRFWLAIGAVAVAAWWCFPPAGAKYMILGLNGQYRGQYSSAWVGMVLAMTSIWLSLVGFYLVRGTLTRDIETRVWQLLVATPLRRHTYLLAKWCSHMLVLALIAGAGVCVGAAAQWLRAEDPHLDLVELVKPVLLLQMPGLALTAMFALWFDLVPWLRRTAGSAVYFVLWLLILAASTQSISSADAEPGAVGDPYGLAVFNHAVRAHAAPQVAAPLAPGFCLGCGMNNKELRRFDWPRWQVDPAVAGERLFWLLLSVLGVVACAPFLERAAVRSAAAGTDAGADPGRRLGPLAALLRPLQRSAFGTLLASEIELTLRQRKLWWWLAVLGSGAVQLAASANAACLAAIASSMLCLDMYAHAALREGESATAALIFSAPGAGRRVLLARWAMLVLVGTVLTLPAVLRFSGSAPLVAAALLALNVSLPAWAVALGAATGSARPFELLACSLAYMGIDGVPVLNAGVDPRFTLLLHLVALPAAFAALLGLWPRLAARPA